MSFGRGMYERNFQRLVEDHLTSIESANSFGRLLPAREVVDQLGHCRRHNFDRRDEALLGQVRLARGRLDSRWLEVAAREARAINMWDHEWIRHHIFNPDSRLQSCRSSRRGRSEDQARPSPSNRSPVRFPQPGGRVMPPPVARSPSPMVASPTLLEEDALLHEDPADTIMLSEPSRPSLSTGHGTTSSQPSVVSTSQGTTSSRPSVVSTSQGTTSSQPSVVSTSQGTTSSRPSVVSTSQGITSSQPSVVSTSQGTTSSQPSVASTSQGTTSSRPSVSTARGTSSTLSGDGRRRRRDRRDVSGNNGPEKKPKFEMVVVPRL